MRCALRYLALILVLPLAYWAASLAGALIPGPRPDLDGRALQTIGLLQGLIHTDILLPLTPDIRARYAFAANAGVPLDDPDAAWLAVGWGSKGFYTTTGSYADISASVVLKAATGDSAVLRFEALGPLPDIPEIRFLAVSDQQFGALLATIDAAFLRGPDGAALALDHPGFSEADAFFEANGDFNLFRTCNVWLGETFRAAGIPFGIWTPTTQSVNLSLWWHQSGQTG